MRKSEGAYDRLGGSVATQVRRIFLRALITVVALFGHPAFAGSGGTSSLSDLEIKGLESRVQANGITIEYQSFGPTDRETVLLIMGTGGQLTMWPVELCEELVKRGYRVIIYDNRDVGLSTRFDSVGLPDWAAIANALKSGTPPPLAYTLADMAKDAVGLLDSLGIKKANIVGGSMGGMIAQMVAARYPERTLSLTSIMATDGKPGLPLPARPEVMAKIPPPAPEGDMEAVIAYNVKVFQLISGPAYPTDERILREHIIRDMMRSYYPAGLARQQAASFVGNFNDRREQLKTIKAPTVVLHGAEDPIVPVAAGRDVAANIPGAELRIVPGMGHDIPVVLVPVVADAIAAAASRAVHAGEAK